MVSQGAVESCTQQISEAIATTANIAAAAAQAATDAWVAAAHNANTVGETVTPAAFRFVEQGTETVGQFVTPLAENPVVKFAAKVPGISLLFTALGHIDREKAQKDLDKLRQEHPQETPEQLAHRIMVDTAMMAGGIGIITNFVPPLALTLFAIDIAAITTLQAEMVYRIAGAYGFSLQEPTRRGEVLAVFGLSLGGSGTLKVGLSPIELLPVVGTFVGASSNAALIYSLGYIACRFYEAKRNSAVQGA